jgi:hypothetical protein
VIHNAKNLLEHPIKYLLWMKSGCGVNESHPLWLKHGRNPSMIDELNDDQ